jgi:hypothetical protein
VKRLAWLGLGMVVLVIVVFDRPWPRTGDTPGPLPGPVGGVHTTVRTTGPTLDPVVGTADLRLTGPPTPLTGATPTP